MKTKYTDRYRVLGLKIAYYRKLKGYTQEAFADEVGISVNFLAQVEAPSLLKGISLETLFTTSDVLEIEPSRLLEYDYK